MAAPCRRRSRASASAMTDISAIPPQRRLVMPKHRHLKWPALDPLEGILMVGCGICMAGFTACVFFDVVTRELRVPWLWLQQFTTGFFSWGVFIGMAAATRRMDHIYLAEITRHMRGTKRLVVETTNRVIVLIVALVMFWFGIKNTMLDWGSFRMPSLIPMTAYTAAVPFAGALIALFSVEQIINGWRNGFEGPEDDEYLGESPE
jgi:TRAP-type C4-dicarboxylate transport system permease small subunit